MKLFPPQSEINIYESGFAGDDLLNRREVGRRLSELLEKIEDPIVVALDGPWGSGKSHFLKRWVGAHQKENGGIATTVYFDAFANDYLEDPLIALTGAIGERLQSPNDNKTWKKAKGFAFKLALPVLRVGAAVATAGASELAGPIADAAIAAGGRETEKAAEAFWRREDGRRQAMRQFQQSLEQLTKPSDDGISDGKPLIVVIDELDRCRPDYALSVLEVVKHFFSVARVHFVLGVNMEALEHIVRVRYGAGVNASDYLKRFISISMQLPEFVDEGNSSRAVNKYFESSAGAMGIDSHIVQLFLPHLILASKSSRISLRDAEKILSRFVLMPEGKGMGGFGGAWKTLIITLVLIQVVRPDLYRLAVTGELRIKEIEEFYGIRTEMIQRTDERRSSYKHAAYIIQGVWEFALSGGKEPADDNKKQEFQNLFSIYGETTDDMSIVNEVIREHFGLFEISD